MNGIKQRSSFIHQINWMMLARIMSGMTIGISSGVILLTLWSMNALI